MEIESNVLESLNAVGYKGKCLQEGIFDETVNNGPKSEDFRELVTWIAYEIHILRNTDEKVEKDTDFNEFMLELSGFLKEIGCPYNSVLSGPLTSRLQSKESRLLLLDFLLTELMASKMQQSLTSHEESFVIPVFESPTARALQSITKELNLGKPPENIPSRALFEKIANKLDEAIKKTNTKIISKPLFENSQGLTDEQWEILGKLQKEFDEEYNLRRQMLLTRLEVTVQSFQWSEKMKARGDEIMTKYNSKKNDLEKFSKGGTDTDMAALLAARTDLAIIEKTSSGNVRKNTASKIQKHVIGKVPDRGGRAYEHAPPPPEMPSWQQNRSTGPSQGGGGGGRGGRGDINRGGGRGGSSGGGGHQGNWNQSNQNNQNNYGNQRQQYDQRQQFDQRQQYEQRQQYNQGQPQYNQAYGQRQDQWQGGSGGARVQGGWSQRGSERSYNQRGNERGDSGYYNSGGGNGGGGSGGGGGGGGGNNYYTSSNQGNYGQNYQNQSYGGGGGGGGGSGNYNTDRGGGVHQRGKSNYNRGGRR